MWGGGGGLRPSPRPFLKCIYILTAKLMTVILEYSYLSYKILVTVLLEYIDFR